MFPIALTCDDVLLVPQYSDVDSRKNISTKCQLTKNIPLNIPLISSNMDTVTESDMAISMALKGGVGIIHRFCSIKEQVEIIKKVKRAQNIIIENPYTIKQSQTIYEALEFMNNKKINCLLVVDEFDNFLGLTFRRFLELQILLINNEQHIYTFYTFPNLIQKTIVGDSNETEKSALEIMIKNHITKLPLVENKKIVGLITLKDIQNKKKYPLMNLDKNGQLIVGAAIGVNETSEDNCLERAKALIEVGVDFICIDIAHGHSLKCINIIKKFKEIFPNIDLIAGNICTPEGYRDLVEAGADCIKVGIGGGSICATRENTGFGVSQLQALIDIQEEYKKYKIPIISDGSVKKPNHISKLLIFSDSIMIGSLFSGTLQAPGKIINKNGKQYKVYRGMSTSGAMLSKEEKISGKRDNKSFENKNEEGVESLSVLKGNVEDIIDRLIANLQSALSYSGGSMETLKKVKIYQITSNTLIENRTQKIID